MEIVLVFIAIFEIATAIVYGLPVSKQITDVYMNLDKTTLRLNMFDPSILSIQPFIATVPFSLVAKYYIKGIGVVPRWSKLHKRINEYYAIAAKNSLNI